MVPKGLPVVVPFHLFEGTYGLRKGVMMLGTLVVRFLAVVCFVMLLPAMLASAQVCLIGSVFALLTPIMLPVCLGVAVMLTLSFGVIARGCYRLWMGDGRVTLADIAGALVLSVAGISGALFSASHGFRRLYPDMVHCLSGIAATVSAVVVILSLALLQWTTRHQPGLTDAPIVEAAE